MGDLGDLGDLGDFCHKILSLARLIEFSFKLDLGGLESPYLGDSPPFSGN